MAIKGKAYTKTTWAFQERPVASSKLNDWDDRIESALELVHRLLNLAWGGGNGVLRTPDEDELSVTALATPALAVAVGSGSAFIGQLPYRLTSSTQTPAIVAPATHARIDLVQARLITWDVSVKTGVEAEGPVAPAPDADCLALAELRLRPGMSVVKNNDDGVNGYIVDIRNFI